MRHLRKLVSLNLFDNIALNHKTHQFLKRVPWNVHQSIFQSFTYLCSYFFKLANPGLFFVYFRSLQTNINTIFTTNQCEQTSCQSSIQCWDSNPQPLKHESSPITTRAGLPPPVPSFLRDKLLGWYRHVTGLGDFESFWWQVSIKSSPNGVFLGLTTLSMLNYCG